jgi:ABC-type Fe3+ transport system permease subunit
MFLMLNPPSQPIFAPLDRGRGSGETGKTLATIPAHRVNASSLLGAVPAAAIVLICSVAPLAWMAAVVVSNPQVRGEFSIGAFRAALLARTMGYNAAAGVIATAMGLPAAFVLGRGRGLIARILWVVIPSALLMPSLSYAYGWRQLVRLLLPMLQPWDVFRCIWSLATWLWAIPATLIGLNLRRLDTGVQQQAILDGALRRVTLRQLAGPIIASVAIVTILATQEFSVYEPTGISVMATEVRMVFDTGGLSSDINAITTSGLVGGGRTSPDQAARAAAAVATSTPILVFTALLAIVAAWGAGRTSAADALETGDWPPMLDSSRWTIALTLLLLLVNIGLPVASLFGSLKIAFSPTSIWEEFGPQVQGSLLVAGIAAAVALIAAFFAAVRWLPGLLAVAGASFLVGGQLLAIAMIRLFNRPHLDWATDMWLVPVIAYVGRFAWLAIAAGQGTWSRPWRDLRDIASVDGASRFRCAVSIVWPLAWPMLLAGGLIVGALSLTEVPATVLLTPANPQVLTTMLMTWLHNARFDPMIEASLLMMGTVLIPAVTAVLLISVGIRALGRNLRP